MKAMTASTTAGAHVTRIVAFDLSATATGVATPNGTLTTWRPDVTGDLRLIELGTRTIDLIRAEQPTLAVIETPLFGPRAARNSAAVQMIHGIVRYQLALRGVPILDVPPATLKIYACGTGKAQKADMRMSLYKRTRLDLADDNQVDAWWLRALGLDLAGAPAIELPKDHRRALDKLKLPNQFAEAIA